VRNRREIEEQIAAYFRSLDLSKEEVAALIRQYSDPKELALANFGFFVRYYLLEYFEDVVEVPEFHETWFVEIHYDRLLRRAPRSHAKSKIHSVAYPLWRIVRNRSVRIDIFSITDKEAFKFTNDMIGHMENNEKLIKDFGRFRPLIPRIWSPQQFLVEGSKYRKDPTVRASCFWAAHPGGRKDLILLDDVVDRNVVQAQASRDKAMEIYGKVIRPTLEPDGQIIAVGTVYHYDDIYARLEATGKYESRTEKAVIDEEKRIVLWPERWPYDKLIAIREEIGTTDFSQQYQNEAVDELNTKFPMAWFKKRKHPTFSMYSSPPAPGSFRSTIMAFDLGAITNKQQAMEKDSNFSAMVMLGIDAAWNRWLMHIWQERGLSPLAMLKKMEYFYALLNPTIIVVEANNFQAWVAELSVELSGLPIHQHTTDGKQKADLWNGISRLQVHMENGKYWFPYQTAEDRKWSDLLILQLNRLGSEKHDDLVMALYMAELNSSNISVFSTKAVKSGVRI